MNIVDFTFGIAPSVQAIAQMLNGRSEEMSSSLTPLTLFKTSPWYNGRERGMVFTLGIPEICKSMNIVVFEHRNGGGLCGYAWITDSAYYLNPPSLNDSLDRIYEDEETISFFCSENEINEMAERIYDTFSEFIDEYVD